MLSERQCTYEQIAETAAGYMADEPMCQTIILRAGPTATIRDVYRELVAIIDGAVALGLLVSEFRDPEDKGAILVCLNGTAGQLGNLAGYMIRVKANSAR